MDIFTFKVNFSDPIFDINHLINLDRKFVSSRTSIYSKKLNNQEPWNYTHYFKRFDDNNCFLFNKDDTLSEFNSDEDKIKYENIRKIEEEKIIIANEEIKIANEKKTYHIVCLSNVKEHRVDKWINSREDFLEIFNSNDNKSLLMGRIEILNKFATIEEIFELFKNYVEKRIILNDYAVEHIYDMLQLMESKGFYDYDINYKCREFDEGELVTLPYYLLLRSHKTGTKTFYRILSDFKFDLNKTLIDENYGQLPFHAIDLLPNFEQEFPQFMKLCVKGGYNMNNTEFLDSTQENITIIDAMYQIGKPELAEELKKLI
jgi:hypothetical protein